MAQLSQEQILLLNPKSLKTMYFKYRNTAKMARVIGINYSSLRNKLIEYEIKKSNKKV